MAIKKIKHHLSNHAKEVMALWLVFLIAFSSTWTNQLTDYARAATYTWTQATWAGGATANTANHTLNKTGWDEYSTASTGGLATSTNMTLGTGSSSTGDLTTIFSGVSATEDFDIAINATSGVAYIVYTSTEYNGGTPKNVALRSSADNYASKTDITTISSGSSAENPRIAIDSNGALHVTYYSYEFNATYTNVALRSSTDNYSTRTDITSVTSQYFIVDPAIVIDSSDNINISYSSREYNSSYANIAIRSSADSYASRTDVSISTSANQLNPAMIIDSADHIYVAWENGFTTTVASSTDSYAYRKAVAINGDSWLSLGVDSSDVVYIPYSDGTNIKIVSSADGFATATSITTDGDGDWYPYKNPNIDVDASNNIHVCYEADDVLNGFNVFYNTGSMGTTWTSQEAFGTTNNSQSCVIAANKGGNAANAIWKDSSNYLKTRQKTAAGYLSSGSLISSPFNTEESTVIVGQLRWDEDSTLPDGTSVTVSLRTASSEGGLTGGWTDFTNATSNCSKASGTVTCTTAAIPSGMKDGSGDQWIQYKTTLTGGTNTPTVDNIIVQYVINAPPEFDSSYGTNGVQVSQVATTTHAEWGSVEISYSIKDPDTTGGANAGFISPSFEYNIGDGNGWQSINSSFMSSTSTSDATVLEGSYTTHTAFWRAKQQVQTATSSAQIRVTVDDSEAANNSANASSATFSLDASPPAVSNWIFDNTSATSTITITDDNSFTVNFSNNADMSADDTNANSGTYISLTSPFSWTLNSTGEETVYLVAKDDYANYATSTKVVPAILANPNIQDVSNTALNLYKEFISWSQYSGNASTTFSSYNIYRSTDDTNFELNTKVTDSAQNYYVDQTVASTTTYYYRIAVEDTNGDVSATTTSVSDLPNGSNADTTGPMISSVAVANTRATTADVTWTTDELSNSIVGYSLSPSTAFDTYATSSSYSTNHTVSLSGLTPNTDYLVKVFSNDVYDNTGSDDNSGAGHPFTTQGGPIITDVAVQSVTDSTATIVWNTDKSASSLAYYSTDSGLSGSTQVGSATLVTDVNNSLYAHSVTLTGLSQSTTYYFKVRSLDIDDNIGEDTNQGVYYRFTTTRDEKPPTISAVDTVLITDTAVVVKWETDELSTSKAQYGIGQNDYTTSTTEDTTLTSQHHYTSINGLSSNTTYYYQVISADSEGNYATSSENSFTTNQADAELTCGSGITYTVVSGPAQDYDPPSISDVKVSDVGIFNASISFDTNEDTIALVRYSEGETYDRSEGGSILTFGKSKQINLLRLKAGTKYNFKIYATDKSGNITESDPQSFTTQFATDVVQGLEGLQDETIFQQRLEDIIESTLPSLVPPFLSDPIVTNINSDSATIEWNTNIKGSSLVAFAPSEEYDPTAVTPYTAEMGDSQEKALTHSVTIVNLKGDTVYHFQARSQGIAGAFGKSQDKVFTTKATRPISNILELDATKLVVSWKSDRPTTSYIEIRNTATGEVKTQGDDELVRDHLISLTDLESATRYTFKVFGRDERRNLTESDTRSVFTIKDTQPPIISNFSIKNALVPGRNDRLQTVVSWKTDEIANSQVFFAEGALSTGELTNSSTLDEFNTLDHTVIISTLKPGTVYRVKAVSTDPGGNTAETSVQVVLTPKQAESIIDIISSNLEETFGWIRSFQ